MLYFIFYLYLKSTLVNVLLERDEMKYEYICNVMVSEDEQGEARRDGERVKNG